jgi:predicted amidophosphoribosyltransferase
MQKIKNMTPLYADLCIRCDKRAPAWGSFFCEACERAMSEPPTPRPGQGKPVAQRLGLPPGRDPNRKPILG